MQKYAIYCILAVWSVSVCAQDLRIIPQPVSVKTLAGSFTLNVAATVGHNKPEAKAVAQMFADQFKKASDLTLPVRATGTVQFNLNAALDKVLGAEGYILEVTPRGVVVQANQPAGLFYGLQTLLQLLPPAIESQTPVKADWKIPAVRITDYPRFAWRGLMLDVSRHFFNKGDVMRYIDQMAHYKYNTFHWHLTDDNGWRIEIKSRPKLTQIGACRVPRYGKYGQYELPQPGEAATDCGFYTQDDIREIVAYAAARHIRVLPEIDVPGHSMAAIAAYPELSCTRDTAIKVNPGTKFSEWYGNGKFKMLIDNTLNPADEGVYKFLDEVFTEVAALFPHPYIHVGGDECYKGYWEENEACKALMKKENLHGGEGLQSYFMKRLEKIISSKGKKMMGWDEILEGGLAPGAAVMSWRGMEGGTEAAKMGHEVVMTPNQSVYIDLPQGDIAAEPDALVYGTVRLKTAYEFEPIPPGVDSKLILGGQANLWTEKVPTLRHAQYMTWPRSWALADVYWSPKETRNWPDFVTRMEHHFGRADAANVNYARSAYDAIAKPRLTGDQLVVDLSTEISGLDIHYTLDETFPDPFTPRYTGQPIVVPTGNMVTLRLQTFRNGAPVGKMIVLSREELLKRAKK